jgi:hypothetical protein
MRRLLKKKVLRLILLILCLLWGSTVALNYYQDYAQMTIDSVQNLKEPSGYQVIGHTRSTSYVLACYDDVVDPQYKCFIPTIGNQYAFQVDEKHTIYFKESPDYSLTWLVDSETAR